MPRHVADQIRNANHLSLSTLNTIFTGGLLAYLVRTAETLDFSATHMPLMAAGSLVLLISLWAGTAHCLAPVRFVPSWREVLAGFGLGVGGYLLIAGLHLGPQRWLRMLAILTVLGCWGYHGARLGARRDAFNAPVQPLYDANLRVLQAGCAVQALALLGLSFARVPPVVMALAGALMMVIAFVVGEVMWARLMRSLGQRSAPAVDA